MVIGGGINGAAISNIACDCGLKVALLEKGDFASGTSSKSTKLIHGGIRYLENLEFGLVRESLRERYIQLKSAPHLVKPLKFIMPVYKGDKRPLWLMHLGVFLYDTLAGKYAIKKHRALTAAETMNIEPWLKKEGLCGSLVYYDAQMDDARLCLENALSAAEKGADIANYREAVSFLKKRNKVIGVKVKDNLSGDSFEVKAKKIICAAGPWANILLKMDDSQAKDIVRATKGIHIVYPKRLSNHAFLIPSRCDERVFFIIPWMNCSLIGTTDTDYSGSPEEVKADDADIEYLINEARRVFPAIEFRKEEIIATFAGLRPLLKRGGAPHKVSRRHIIFETPSGVIFVIGGKYTTYRKIAMDCIKKITKIKARKEFCVYGSGAITERPEDIAKKYGLDLEIVNNLMNKYGIRYKDVLKLTDLHPELKEKVCPHFPIIMAEAVYAVKFEMAKTKDDIIYRRLSIGYCICNTRECDEVIEKIILANKEAKA